MANSVNKLNTIVLKKHKRCIYHDKCQMEGLCNQFSNFWTRIVTVNKCDVEMYKVRTMKICVDTVFLQSAAV